MFSSPSYANPGQDQQWHNWQRLFGASGSGASEVDLRELLRKLWRRRRVIVGTVVVLTVLSILIAFQLTPKYTASALVMVETRENQVVDIQSVLSGLPPGTETLNSEIQIIRSRKLAGVVVDRLKLELDPEFNGALREKSVWAMMLGWLREQKQELISSSPDEASTETPLDPAVRQRLGVIESFLGAVSVSLKEQSRVIEISIESESSQKASRIANALVDQYLVSQLEAKYEATRRANEWLQERLTGLRESVQASERAVEAFRHEHNLIKGKDDTSLVSNQVSELSSQLIIARAKRAEAEARLGQIEGSIKSGGIESVSEVLSSRLIQSLRERESDVLSKSAELSAEYGAKHPRMIAVRTEIRNLREKIRAEVRKIIDGLKSEVEIAKARESSLNDSLGELEQRMGTLNRKDVQLRSLEREAQANSALLETFLVRFKETSAQKDIQTPDARIVSPASIPTLPSFPRKGLIIGLTLMASIFLGVVLVFAIEQLDAGFRSMEQIEKLSGHPALGLMPDIKKKIDPIQFVLDEPVSAYAESLRNLHVSLSLSDVDNPPKVILMTSAGAEEAKTTTSISLARLLARAGHKVIVIDCDLRKPSVHERMGLPRKPGLVELLANKEGAKSVIQKDDASGADVIVAGERAASPPDLLGSGHMKQLLAELSKEYDLVILDSSPTLAVTDSRVLARFADKVVFVIRWEKTRREAALLGIKQIKEAGGDLAGAVLSVVDARKHAQYDFADSGYYHGKYTKYYTN